MDQRLFGALLLAGASWAGPIAADDGEVPVGGNTPVKCEEAFVSPVSGHAECVRPMGAPVEPPPPRPDPCAAPAQGPRPLRRGCINPPQEPAAPPG